MSKPKVATITLSWNQKDDLRELLKCVRTQSYRVSETIVVDNGSEDGTIEMIRKEFPPVALQALGTNTGYATGYNICFDKVPSDIDYVVVLDQDIIIDKDYVKKIVERFKEEPETTAIIAGDVQETRIKSLVLSKDYIKGFHGSCFAYRNKYKKYMNYPKEFFAYACEADLSARLLNKGLKILYDPSIRTIHKRDSAKRSTFSIFLETRNALWFAWRNINAIDVIPLSLEYILVYYNKATKSEQVPAFIKGIISAFLGLPYCVRTREVCRHIKYRDYSPLFSKTR